MISNERLGASPLIYKEEGDGEEYSHSFATLPSSTHHSSTTTTTTTTTTTSDAIFIQDNTQSPFALTTAIDIGFVDFEDEEHLPLQQNRHQQQTSRSPQHQDYNSASSGSISTSSRGKIGVGDEGEAFHDHEVIDLVMKQKQAQAQAPLTPLSICYNEDNDDSNHGEMTPIMTMIDSSSTTSTTSTKKLTLLPLAIIVFYNVSGGPFGIEPSIHSAGNFFAILGFIIGPFIWSIPEALITAELGSIFCTDSSGGVAWVEEAFGKNWGLLCGYLSWISGATDNAIYPTLFLQYAMSVARTTTQQGEDSTTNEDEDDLIWVQDYNLARFGFVSILSVLLALLNYRGLEIVGNASIAICIIAMSPFIIMTILGIPKMDPSKWFQLPDSNCTLSSSSSSVAAMTLFSDDEEFAYHDATLVMENASTVATTITLTTVTTMISIIKLWCQNKQKRFINFTNGVQWTPFINNLFWNLNSFDAASSFANEVVSVTKTYPKGIFLGLILTILFYIIPLLVVTACTSYKQSEWVDGQLGKAAIDIGGSWLGTWVVFAAGISNLALFEAELSSDSYQLMGMAERGHLPPVFATRSKKFGTPTVGILMCTIVIILLSIADFSQLVELLNFNYAIALLMEYCAFVKLRLTRKDCK